MLFVLFLQLLRFLGFWEWSFHGVSFGAFGLVKGMSLVFAFLDALMVSSVLLGAVFYVLFTRAWRPLVFSYELKDFDRMYPQSEGLFVLLVFWAWPSSSRAVSFHPQTIPDGKELSLPAF
jgi:hypothetical protein